MSGAGCATTAPAGATLLAPNAITRAATIVIPVVPAKRRVVFWLEEGTRLPVQLALTFQPF